MFHMYMCDRVNKPWPLFLVSRM